MSQPSPSPSSSSSAPDAVHVSRAGHVATVTLNRPPHNHVDPGCMAALADALDELDRDDDCRAVVLAAQGKSFCAGADFGAQDAGIDRDPAPFYRHAMRLFRTRKPIVAAVHGAAVGAGAGLALVADFRVTCREARFSVNFNRLGFHPGFGLSLTLPRLIGEQRAALLFYTGRRIDGETAVQMGLADVLVEQQAVLEQARILAEEIAASAPLAVESTRATLRAGLADRIEVANRHELAVQLTQFPTEDFREGVKAMAERRLPQFHRR
ncbi:enoyl-CoA hydratase/isomerase family protein [Cupriavidus sp. AU9028]|uniref:enoyl-CoA hydratase/isomerase family protein n=1 Tax=Cupriavidus sp. AU9028 TaxID=2871157 RepID=UPI001C94A878|nr:enoyl-CoA hydratase/isomerase family protein [Cupriavidus sp. AU9028]MBY4899111.1 enoyl-CoA hydratase/isomerase family protein [Cupriavidus sp. AU9028]